MDIVGFTWVTIQFCLAPLMLLIQLCGVNVGPQFAFIVNTLMFPFANKGGEPLTPLVYPHVVIGTGILWGMLALLYLPLSLIAYAIYIYQFMPLYTEGWLILIYLAGVLVGMHLAGKVMRRIDDYFGIQEGFGAMHTLVMAVGTVYMGIKAAKGVKDIITKI